jgi:hypothetical protein
MNTMGYFAKKCCFFVRRNSLIVKISKEKTMKSGNREIYRKKTPKYRRMGCTTLHGRKIETQIIEIDIPSIKIGRRSRKTPPADDAVRQFV